MCYRKSSFGIEARVGGKTRGAVSLAFFLVLAFFGQALSCPQGEGSQLRGSLFFAYVDHIQKNPMVPIDDGLSDSIRDLEFKKNPAGSLATYSNDRVFAHFEAVSWYLINEKRKG